MEGNVQLWSEGSKALGAPKEHDESTEPRRRSLIERVWASVMWWFGLSDSPDTKSPDAESKAATEERSASDSVAHESDYHPTRDEIDSSLF